MDRVSAVLIIGIIMLLIINGAIIYDTWIASEDAPYEVLIYYGNGDGFMQTDEPACL